MPEELRFCPFCGSRLLLEAQQFCAACGHRLSPKASDSETVAATAAPPVAAGAVFGAAPDKVGAVVEPMALPQVTDPAEPAVEDTGPVAVDHAAAGAAGITHIPAAPPTSAPGAPAPWETNMIPEESAKPQQSASRSAAPSTATPQDLLIAAGCSAGALIATALPWANRILVPPVAGLQLIFPLIPPVAALVACWMLHSNMPKSLSTGRKWGLRISLALGLLAGVLVLAVFGQREPTYGFSVSDVAQPAVGLWLYLIACGAGLVFAFRIPKAGDLA
jgi:hypothetical protein